MVRFPGLQPEGMLSLSGRAVAMVLPPGIRTELDTDLQLEVASDDAVLSGTVSVLRGDYRERVNTAGGLLALLESRAAPPLVATTPSWLDGVRLDVGVLTEEEIVVNNNYGAGTAAADIRLGGTLARPALTGRVTVGDGGQVFLGANVFEIETGSVDFVDPAGIVPALDVTARTQVASEEITITLAGTADTLTTTIQSSTGLSESDIVSLLLTGRTLEQVGDAPGAVALDQALGLVSGQVLGAAGRSVGLDTVRLERGAGQGDVRFDPSLVAGDTNPGTRVTAGKNLSPRVQLVASHSLRESGLLTWIVNYLPRSNLELAAGHRRRHRPLVRVPACADVRRNRGAADAGCLACRAAGLGGPVLGDHDRTRVGAAEAGAPGSQATSSTFYAGRTAGTASSARCGSGGSRRRGSGRAATSKRPEPRSSWSSISSRVRGPCWMCAGTNSPVRSSVKWRRPGAPRSSTRSWSRKLARLARRHLVDQGYLQPMASAGVVAGGGNGEKRITLEVEPGPRAAGRVIRFSGNDRLTDGRLGVLVTPDRATDALGGRRRARRGGRCNLSGRGVDRGDRGPAGDGCGGRHGGAGRGHQRGPGVPGVRGQRRGRHRLERRSGPLRCRCAGGRGLCGRSGRGGADRRAGRLPCRGVQHGRVSASNRQSGRPTARCRC